MIDWANATSPIPSGFRILDIYGNVIKGNNSPVMLFSKSNMKFRLMDAIAI